MRADIDRWNTRFAANPEPVEARGEPELAARSDLLTGQGLGLELACGRGANALFLAGLGYQVIAMDGSIHALRQCASASRRHGLAVFPVVTDLDRTSLPMSAFRLISVVRYLNRDLFPAIVAALAPGGILFYKTFNRLHLVDHPRFNPDFVLRDNELPEAFGSLETLGGEEGEGSSWILARRPASGQASGALADRDASAGTSGSDLNGGTCR